METSDSSAIIILSEQNDSVQAAESSKTISTELQKTKTSEVSKILSKKGIESQINKNSISPEQIPSKVSDAASPEGMNMECTEDSSVNEDHCKEKESAVSVNAMEVEKCQNDIIDLDEEETLEGHQNKLVQDDKKDLSKKNCCECGTCDGTLKNAPVFVLTYYGLKYVPGKLQKVCERCFEEAVKHQEYLAHVLKEHKPLLSAQFPVKKDIVVIQDSDEEGSDEGEHLSEDIIADIDEKLLEVIDSSLENYDIDFQVRESESLLKAKFTELEGEFQETDQVVSNIQREIDDMRNILYREFAPKIKELPPLEIKPPTPIKCKQVSGSSTLFPSPSKWSSLGPVPLPESPRRSQITGVATKKVTQVQRVMLPGLPQIEMTPQNYQLQLPTTTDNLTRGYQQQDIVALDIRGDSFKPALPPMGQLVRPRPQMGEVYYVMKQGYYGIWVKAKVIDIIEGSQTGKSEYLYKIKFENRKYGPTRNVSGRQLAYSSPCSVLVPVGTRVIALFQDDWAKECYYAGIVAEPPKTNNRYRYLVFFDDGYAQYLHHEKILVVCESSRNVWEDIHPESRDFIRGYLQQFPERPMVKLQQSQVVKTEWNGKWWVARVLEVDGSLVKMHFDADGRTELIYRGSTRLGPLYAELAQAASRKTAGAFSRHRGMGIASLKRRNMPYVEYTRGDMEEITREDSRGIILEDPTQKNFPSRAVAKKSTTRMPETAQERLDSLILTSDNDLRTGKVERVQIDSPFKPKKFSRHQCGSICIGGIPFDPTQVKHYNPLVLPQLHAWQRIISRCRTKRLIFYRGPCGRRFRSMEEVHRFLRVSKSPMSVDQFDFDFWVHCFSEFIVSRGFTNIKDLSYGFENVPVPCVNNIDHTRPEYVKYSTIRLPMDGVNLNLDPEFLICCDCTDDCQDKDKCACWQLTIQGTAYASGGQVDPSIGYCYKRLLEPVTTGIYECNSRCKCASTCLNRVVQHPLQLRLQVFKTENRGWGIRCLNDVPQGAFICIYAGRLLTEQGANACVYVEEGKNYGDEYLAELDYIEVVERLKEGYESDVVEDEDMCLDTNKRESDGKGKIERSQAESPLSDDDDGEASQDARDSDYELDSRHMNIKVSAIEESTIRTRLRNRKLRSSSEETVVAKEKAEKEEKSERNSIEKDMKKLDLERKSNNTFSDDSFSLITLSDDEDDVQRQPSRFAAVAGPKAEKPKYKSVREYFGEDEYCYIMDAKNDGNIGRYLNHSCSPNVFVQNVFVDTHDLRFPWVAFFALSYISAGTELTWDYNYDVGSVPGKVLHCYCGSSECRGRLL